MDQSATPFASNPEFLRPAEVIPAPSVYQADAAARLAYADRGSYGLMLHEMFREAERNPELYSWSNQPAELRDRVGSRDTEAFQDVLSTVYDRLKESDAIKAIRYSHRPIESANDIEACYRAYERALEVAIHRTPLTDRQASKLKFAAHSELDWSLRDLVINHSLEAAAGRAEPRYEPKDFLLMLNPKARKVDYMDSGEILSVLRRSGSLASRDRLKADLSILRQTNRQEAQAALQAFEGA